MPTSVARDVIQCSVAAEKIIQSDRIAAMWNQPSALEGYDVGALTGHLARAIFTAEQYATASATEGKVIDAAHYFVIALGDDDPIDSPLHRQIRRRGASEASNGTQDLLRRMQRSRATLANALSTHDVLDRRVDVRAGQIMTVDEYLKTRLVELVVHVDDLATSVDLDETPEIPDSAYQTAAGVLAQVAAVRNGGLATVRGLARRERYPKPVRAL